MSTMAACQSAYDAMLPPDDDAECPECGQKIEKDADGTWKCTDEDCEWGMSPDDGYDGIPGEE